MTNNSIMNCPVCGSPANSNSEGSACKVCGTQNALVTAFAEQATYAAWKKQMDDANREWNARKLSSGQENLRLILGSEQIMFLNRQKQQLMQLSPYEDARILSNYKQVSTGKLHWAAVTGNDQAYIDGNNDYGQCAHTGAKEVDFVLAAPRCTYLVKKDGTVTACGACSTRDAVARWSNVRCLCSVNADTVVALTRQGRLLSTAPQLNEQLSGLDNVVDVAASGYVLALHANGTVSCVGNDEISRQIRNWPEVTAIAADNQYAVGLTPEGKVLLAGQKPFMDMGRSDAANWENVMCIAASPLGGLIGGITANGQLLLAGLCVDGEEMQKQFAANAKNLL